MTDEVGPADVLVAPIDMNMEFAIEGGQRPTPYEVLLHAAMIGDTTRFARQDEVEEARRVFQPQFDAPPPVQPYDPGTWGPKAARDLPAGYGAWREPWVSSTEEVAR